MRKDVSTFTRYFVFLLLVFVVWILLVRKVSREQNLGALFGKNNQSLSILEIVLCK